MAEPLEDLGEDVGFEQGAAHGAEPRLGRAPPAPEPRRQPRVQEVQLGTLGHPPGPVGETRRQQLDQETVLQQAEPILDGGGGDVGVAREVPVVDHLPGAQRAQLDEGLELPALLHAQQLADVAFDIRLHVGRKVEVPGGPVLDAVEPGEPGLDQPSEEVVGGKERGEPLFLVRKPQQVEHRHPPGQGFGDPGHHPEVLGPGEPDGPGPKAARVHEALDGAQQTGRILDLVDDEGRPELPHEQHRIPVGAFPSVEVVEAHVRVAVRAPVQQGTLAHLPRSQQQPDRKEPQILRGTGQHRLEGPVDPRLRHILSLLHICRNGKMRRPCRTAPGLGILMDISTYRG